MTRESRPFPSRSALTAGAGRSTPGGCRSKPSPPSCLSSLRLLPSLFLRHCFPPSATTVLLSLYLLGLSLASLSWVSLFPVPSFDFFSFLLFSPSQFPFSSLFSSSFSFTLSFDPFLFPSLLPGPRDFSRSFPLSSPAVSFSLFSSSLTSFSFSFRFSPSLHFPCLYLLFLPPYLCRLLPSMQKTTAQSIGTTTRD